MNKKILTPGIIIIMLMGCNNSDTDTKDTITTTGTMKTVAASPFEQHINGKATKLYNLQNKNMKAAITNYGGRLISLWVPDKNGNMTDVVEGFDSLQQYINSTEPYFGATIGRYGNRIAKGKFKIDGIEHTSSINNPPNMLHGGKNGFQSQVFDAKQIGDTALELTY